ncbi:MAG: helix-turn-helix domain-containing protein [Kiritimatiellae bacterium]|nr:helix-turn-helix domain-containing protein [Kiritimatiellia bacterium]
MQYKAFAMQYRAGQRRLPSRQVVQRMLKRIVTSMRFDRRHVTVLAVQSGCARPGQAPGYHVHETGELAVALSGPLFCQVSGGDVQRLPSAHLVLIPGGVPHYSFQSLMQQYARRKRWFSLVMSFGEAAAITNEGGVRRETILMPEERKNWRAWLGHEPANLFRAVPAAMAANAPWCDAYLDSSLRLYLAALQASLRDDEEEDGVEEGDAVARTIRFINRHYADTSLSMAGIAAVAGLNRHRLEALFRKATGTTVWQMLVETRLAHAHGLLVGSRFSVKEIAARTGWSNQLYFSSVFRQRFGHSPSDVRRHMLPLAQLVPSAHRRSGQRKSTR